MISSPFLLIGLTIPLEVLDTYVENSKEKLYGGAQYYRLQREFEAGTIYFFLCISIRIFLKF